jgi:hypothetical protein
MEATTQRYGPTDVVEVEELSIRDRIARPLVPPTYAIPAGDPRSKHYQVDTDEPFIGRVVARNTSQHDIRHCLIVDDENGRFARLSAHSKSQAWSKKEEDWKVRDLGFEPKLVDAWDVEIDDLRGETPEEFVGEWLEILFDNARHGEDVGHEIRNFEGDTFTLADYDGRRSNVEYELIDDN